MLQRHAYTWRLATTALGGILWAASFACAASAISTRAPGDDPRADIEISMQDIVRRQATDLARKSWASFSSGWS